ncbi:MAG: glycosyltransferase [Elusimicrobiota bacterium]
MLVYGYHPSGHAAAAFSLSEAFRKSGFLVSSVEVSEGHHPGAGQAVARGYHFLLRSYPALWGMLYGSDSSRAVLRGVRRAYLASGGARRLRSGVSREAPDVIVCPQAAVAAVFAEARRRGDLSVPVVSVLTDYGAHPFWADPPADLIVVPSPAVVDELRRYGVPASRMTSIGIPIHPAFSVPPSRPEARRALGLPSAAPVVLLSGGSRGYGDLAAAAAALLAASPRAVLLVLCGMNDGLRRALSARREAGDRLRVFGPQPPALVASMLAASDLHLGKPGGLTAAESLALSVPMVLTRPLPGQEDANARFLLGSGAAVAGGNPVAAARLCAALLNDPARLSALGASAGRAGVPDAASRIAAEIGGLLVERGRLAAV